jgi:Replication protein
LEGFKIFIFGIKNPLLDILEITEHTEEKMDIDNIKIDATHVAQTQVNREYNKKIIEYYDTFLQKEQYLVFKKETLFNKRNSLENCNKVWILDYYKNLNIKKIHKIHLCKDKNCSNCKKVVQASRMAKYIPNLEPYSSYLYHLTLTLPNVDGNGLHMTIKSMAKAFRTLIRYLDGRAKIKGLDFSSWGYEGAIRSLEITFNGDNYHPHYHVAIALKNLELDKTYINTYSYNYKNGIKELKKIFSTEEILIQKIWYLLLNNKTVNLKNINNLDLGYSCNMDLFRESEYQELFKYMTKGADEEGGILTYDNFVTLMYSTYRVKQIQGYGCFYNVTDEGDEESLVEMYNAYIDYLEKNDTPIRIQEFLSITDKNKIVENLTERKLSVESFEKNYGVVDCSKSTYISLKKFMQYMNTI